MKRILFCMLAMIVMFVLVTPAQALLINRGTDTLGNRLIYDDVLGITWYDYSNVASTWQDQVDWADELSVDFGGDIYDDWRLPTTVDGAYEWGYDGNTTTGYNITTSEMGNLFYTELGNLGYYDTSGSGPQSGYGLSNTGDFQNLVSSFYWSGTGDSGNTILAWLFNFTEGFQDTDSKSDDDSYGLAVRSGDVEAFDVEASDVAAVPEPTTIALLGIGLVGMGVYGVRRRRQLRYKES